MSALSPPFISELPLTCEALEYAVAHHEGQRRDSDAAPFILHLLEVAVLLRNRGYDDEVVAAGLLHDLVEDTDASSETTPSARRRCAGRSSAPARTRRRSSRRTRSQRPASCAPPSRARPPRPTTARRLEHHESSLSMLERALPEHPLPRQLRFELWALRTLPPSSPTSE